MWSDVCFEPAMIILSKCKQRCGYLLRSIVTVSFSKNSNGIFQYFSVVKGIRRPDIQFIPAKSAKEIDQIIII